ncbi:MAG: eight-cysteine-cluster domain-containing protein [bacterium]|nr:eight-cysteine-cluster domain-containing protein [bacterium]
MKTISIGLVFVVLFLSACSTSLQDSKEDINTEDFCGTSTQASCTIDADCKASGCSGQVCQSINEEERITTCEYRDCYNAGAYALSCACKEQKCSWA